MKFATTLLLAFFFLSSSLFARTWKQKETGKEIEAELVKVEGGKAHLRLANGRVGQVDITSLSDADQEFIKQQASGGSTNFASSAGANWPQFRGANHDGISPDADLLDEWPEGGPEKLWVYEGAGLGYSGIIVVGGKLFTQGTQGDDVTVVCVDVASGKEVWNTSYSKDDQQGYSAGWGHGPRGTPTYSDGKIYALGPKGTLVCLNAEDGKKEWDKNYVDDFGGKWGGWGYSASPFVDGENLIIAPGGEDAGIVCLKKDTGAVVWKASDVKPGKAEYATIVPAEINGVRQYVRLFERELVGVAAEDGKLLWSSPWDGKTAVIPTPIVDGNEIYITSGYGVGCKLVRVKEDFSTEDVWVNKTMKNHHGGVVKVGEKLYGFSDGGGLICQDWDSGEMTWNEKGQYTSKGSVHVADGKLYALNEGDGVLTLADASPDGFEQKGQLTLEPQSANRNPKGKIWTHPVVVGGKLFLRDQEIVICYDVSAK